MNDTGHRLSCFTGFGHGVSGWEHLPEFPPPGQCTLRNLRVKWKGLHTSQKYENGTQRPSEAQRSFQHLDRIHKGSTGFMCSHTSVFAHHLSLKEGELAQKRKWAFSFSVWIGLCGQAAPWFTHKRARRLMVVWTGHLLCKGQHSTRFPNNPLTHKHNVQNLHAFTERIFSQREVKTKAHDK